MWRQKPNLHNLPLFRCKSEVHEPNTLREKLDPKTKECIFLGYAEGVKAGVFEHVVTCQRFVSRDDVVESVRLNSESIVGGSSTCQGKSQSNEVSFVQSEDDPYETKTPPTTKGSSTYTHEIYNDPLMGYQEIPTRRPRQLLVRFMHKWALTTQVEDKQEPLTMAEALMSVHWREAMETEYKSLVHNDTWKLFPCLQTEPSSAVSGVIAPRPTREEQSSDTK